MAYKKPVQGRTYPYLYNVTMTVGSRKSVKQTTNYVWEPYGATDGGAVMSASVPKTTTTMTGSYEPNKPDDVMLVQYLLKRIYQRAQEYQPQLNPRCGSFWIADLKVDGFCGPKTQASIEHFQLEMRRNGYSIVTDGCVETERTGDGFASISGEAYTITQLNAGYFEKYPLGFLETDPECPPRLKAALCF